MDNRIKYFFLFLCMCSCGEYEILEHNKRVNKQVDSLYRVHKDSLFKHSDSICNNMYEIFVQEAVDSIQQIRIKEIEKLIEQ